MSTLYPQLQHDANAVPDHTDEEEERELGSVSWKVYTDYIKATGSWFWIIVSGLFLILTQIVQVANSLFLGWWFSDEFGMKQDLYMAVYAGKCHSLR
jgi:ATP-binding cassette subfamily C (CFTR/MRP) protein 1